MKSQLTQLSDNPELEPINTSHSLITITSAGSVTKKKKKLKTVLFYTLDEIKEEIEIYGNYLA